MKRLLWVGDAGCSTGFARATHHTLAAFLETWDVHVCALNYEGDPVNQNLYPYDLWPAAMDAKDPFGIARTARLVTHLTPDVVIVQNDPWNIPRYMKAIGRTDDKGRVATIAAVAVDGKNCRGRALNGLAGAIFWTHFALNEARLGGYTGPAAVVPLGVDLNIYHPIDQFKARQLVLPQQWWDRNPLGNAFIVGNVNRNQPRKRLDLTIHYFAEWVKRRKITDAYLYFHVCPTAEDAWDLEQLMAYHGLASRLILAEPAGDGATEEALNVTYNTMSVMLTCTQGEGMGLPTLEGMACGIPQIVPDWSALGEWAKDAAWMVPCSELQTTPNRINVIGATPDRESTLEALDALYDNPALRADYRAKGLALAARPEYRWSHIGNAFLEAVERMLDQFKPGTPPT